MDNFHIQDPELQEAFNKAKEALIMDYMYMGTETDQDGFKYLLFKHIETREYIKIAERVK